MLMLNKPQNLSNVLESRPTPNYGFDRAGRVTASRFKATASRNVAQSSQSLVKAVCYHESLKVLLLGKFKLLF